MLAQSGATATVRSPGRNARIPPNESERKSVELRCQLRFAPVAEGACAILEARDPEHGVTLTVEATGADRAAALTLLAERTRELYGAVCQLVDTVEEVTRQYYADDSGD